MATKKKLLQAAAGNAGGDALNVEDVFSTYLYTGNGSTQTITNGIDLDGEGGLVWIKSRSTSENHILTDSARGVTKLLNTNNPNAEASNSDISAFNSDGFSLQYVYGSTNTPSTDYASWTFRKAPKFFDVVTYTGNGASSRAISHNLNSTPGMIIIKQTSSNGENWIVWHRSISNVSNGEIIYLNATDSESGMNGKFDGANLPTSTTFTIEQDNSVNASNATYVAYLFAHNDGDGEFGPDGDADIIKCGSYTGNNSTNGPEIDLGFEPQWIMIKNATASQSWWMFDTMRGIATSSNGADDARLRANATTAEDTQNRLHVTSTGFKLTSSASGVNDSSTFIYIAIRRGTAVPTSATDVFDVNQTTSNQFVTTGFPVDLQLMQYTGGDNTYVVDRMRGMSTSTTGNMKFLMTQKTNVEASDSGSIGVNGFVQDGFSHTLGNFEQALWSWKRAPNYMDVVAYTGNGTPNNHAPTLTHNLGAVPEMLWVKKRSGTSNWAVVVKSGTGGVQAYLDSNNGNVGTLATTGPSNTWSDYFTSTQVIGDGGSGSAFYSPFPVTNLNVSGSTYIMYLFATLAGISKVGSVTHSGTTNVDCGFSSGSRFVLLKRTDSTGDWYVWDSVRGIVSGNDPYLLLNTTGAEVTNTDYIDPLSSGFTITDDFTDGDYIFYAIA